MVSLRFGRSTSVLENILKIYFTHPQRMILKCVHGSQITVHDYDFRTFDVGNGQRHRFSPSSDHIVRGYSSLGNILNIGIRCSESQGFPSILSSGSYTIPSDVSYPFYLWVESGQTETEEPISVIPTWLPVGATPDAFQASRCVRIAQAAQYVVDRGLRYRWRSLDRARYNNIDLWSRLLIGYAWREVFALDSSSVGSDYERVLVLIEDLHAQFKGDWRYMREWFVSHDQMAWQTYTRDTATGRQVWTSTDDAVGDRLVYDINASNTVDGNLDDAAASAEYSDIITTNFLAALGRSVPGYGDDNIDDVKL